MFLSLCTHSRYNAWVSACNFERIAVFNTEQYHFGRPFAAIRRKYAMNRIFFVNPDPVMDFPLLIDLSSFAFLFLRVLLRALYPLPPDSSHFTRVCPSGSPLDPSLKARQSRSKWQIPLTRNVFYKDAECSVSSGPFLCVKCPFVKHSCP